MDGILKSLEPLLKLFFDKLGVGWTIALLLGIGILLFAFRCYKDWRKDREIHLALQAKDKTIQIIAEQNRQYRVLELKEKGLSDEMITALVLENTPANPAEARAILERNKTNPPVKPSKQQPKRQRRER